MSMEVEKYIASGILELYVAGTLTPEQNLEVQHYALQYPEIQKEIEEIEASILKLTESTSPKMQGNGFRKISAELDDVIPFTPLESRRKTSWGNYVGWAASILLAVGLFWLYSENRNLQSEVEISNQEKLDLEETLSTTKDAIARKDSILEQLRNQNVSVIALGGQAVSPTSYAKVYWNKEQNSVIIDAQGLPEPPSGYTYQVWSLTLDPLTPTSIGLLDNLSDEGDKLFALENPNASEAFGITLEPEGGSESPTLEQLYALGTVGR